MIKERRRASQLNAAAAASEMSHADICSILEKIYRPVPSSRSTLTLTHPSTEFSCGHPIIDTQTLIITLSD